MALWPPRRRRPCKTKLKNQKNFCSKLYKRERLKFYSDLYLNKITDNKLFWKTIKPLLSDKCLESSAISLVDNNNVISEDSELANTFNSYLEKTVIELGIKESFDMNLDSRFLDNVDIAINKYKNHPSIKMVNENVSFESKFNFKDHCQLKISKKAGMLVNIPAKELKES